MRAHVRGKIGNAVVHNLREFGFQGDVYAVNPTAETIEGAVSYPSLDDVPGPVDLVIVVRPAAEALDIVAQATRKRARSGDHCLRFRRDGSRRTRAPARSRCCQREATACAWSVRTASASSTPSTACASTPRLRRVSRCRATFAFLSQSGGLGIELLSQAAGRGIGVSQFVSVGNKGDVSGNDLLQFWEDDVATEVVLLYLESFGNPRKFARIARRVSQRKPIVAVKSGRTPAGTRGATSHTAALAASDVAVDALFHQAGVIRVDTLEELLDTAQLLAAQPVPAGRRVRDRR